MKNILLLIIASFLISSCTGDRCIDPDDFGFFKFTVPARYDESEIGNVGENNQLAPWINTNAMVNGNTLIIGVKTWDSKNDKNTSGQLSAWCPWYGSKTDKNNLAGFCTKLQRCKFINDRMCSTKKDAEITNSPCIMKDGVGLYALVSSCDSNPNATFQNMRNPDGITLHLGEKHDNPMYELTSQGKFVPTGGVKYEYNSTDKIKYNKCPLYMKILDKFYSDNSGQYKIVVKSGIQDTRPDPLEFLTNLVKDNLFGKHGIVKNIYQGVVDTPAYQGAVMGMLTLYLVLTGFGFVTGNINITQTELATRVIKISIISMLLSSSNSWRFFHDYLFVFFIEGIEGILGIINQASTNGSGSTSIINLMIAHQTMAKLFSLLFTDWLGFIYIILFFIALYFIFMMIFKATIIYLTAIIAIGMMIIMAPIFISFLLFGFTKSLFENWLKQLISYSLQPIILWTGVAFISMIIRSEIYSSLGFGVCKYDFLNIAPITDLVGDLDGLDDSLGTSIFFWWFPQPMRASKFTKIMADIPVPVDHTGPDGKFCAAYQCTEKRYIELPFLDPTRELDKRRINNFFNGKFVQLDGLWLIFLSVYLLSKFNNMAISIASFIAGTYQVV